MKNDDQNEWARVAFWSMNQSNFSHKKPKKPKKHMNKPLMKSALISLVTAIFEDPDTQDCAEEAPAPPEGGKPRGRPPGSKNKPPETAPPAAEQTTPAAGAPAAAEAPPAGGNTLDEVRALVQTLVKENRGAEVKALLAKFGSATVSALDPKKYTEFHRDLEALTI